MRKLIALTTITLLLLSSCAKMGQPDGGWYDETPPAVIGAIPQERSTGVDAKKITIYFNEYIKLDNPTEKVVVSPADGTVVAIEEVDEPDYFKDRRIVVSIFMSVYSVHANWFPVNGTVKIASHQSGNFHAAFKPKASTENERSLVVIETADGHEVMLRQIAGAVARRVVTYCKPGDESRIDSHLGFIKFGSRVDVYLPVDSLVCIKLNQKVTGDQTILAKLS